MFWDKTQATAIRPSFKKLFVKEFSWSNPSRSSIYSCLPVLVFFIFLQQNDWLSKHGEPAKPIDWTIYGYLILFLISLQMLSVLCKYWTSGYKVSARGLHHFQIDPTLSLIRWKDIRQGTFNNSARSREYPYVQAFEVIYKTPKSYIAYKPDTISTSFLFFAEQLPKFKQAVLEFAPEGNPLREYVERAL